jgi:hypothetical protein
MNGAFKRWTERPIFKLVALVVGWRIALLVVAALAPAFFAYEPTFPYSEALLISSHLPAWLYSWANFDGVHYLTIIESGYQGTGLIQAFFPVYPMLVSVLELILSPLEHIGILNERALPIAAGVLLSSGFWMGAVVIFWQFVARTHSPKVAWWAVLGLLSFPTAFFAGALYTEGLFMFLVLGTFLAVDRQKWWLAFVLAAIATGTRVVGAALFPALVVALLESSSTSRIEVIAFIKSISVKIKDKTIRLLLFATPLSLLGLALYSWYLWQNFGDPLLFVTVQADFNTGRSSEFILLPQTIWRQLKIVATVPIDWKWYSYVFDLGATLAAGGAIVWGALKTKYNLKLSWLTFASVALLIPTLTGSLTSMSRYVLVAFPIWILLGVWLSKRSTFASSIYILISSVLLVISLMLFTQGHWIG